MDFASRPTSRSTRAGSYVAVLGLLFVSLATTGCKGESSPHPAAESAEAFLEAVQYGDFEGASRLHVEGTAEGFYCDSQSFEEALEKARTQRTPSECERLEALGAGELEQFDPETRLMIQIVRFICETPDGECSDYGREVFRSHLEAAAASRAATRWNFRDFEVRKVVGGEEEAVAYVDLFAAEGDAEPMRVSYAMERVDGEWYLAQRPEEH